MSERARAERRPLRALAAQRIADVVMVRAAPAAAAGLVAYSHLREPGAAAIAFFAVLAAMAAIERVRLPLGLMPTSRALLYLAGPLAGTGAAWLIAAAAGAPAPLATYQAIVLGAWGTLALGAWMRSRLADAIRARVAIIGPRAFACDLAAEIASGGEAPYRVVGWIGAPEPPAASGLRWLGELADVRSAVLEHDVELLICAAEAAEGSERRLEEAFERVAEECLDLPVRLLTANQLYEEALGHVPVGTIDAAWYRYIMHPRYHASGPASKRLFDLAAGAAIALAALPLLALAAAAIALSGRGPILYRQRRLGANGREFEIVKLRTMRVGSERSGPRWAEAGDERITRVGRVLRRSHVDEIPQLWNVLRGEMTLVGPRPERPEIVSELERRFPHYSRRGLVKPGITGWAQLRCGYAGSELGTAWKLCHDLFYIKRRSVAGDALILAETASVAFRDAHRALRSPRERFLLHLGTRTPPG